MPLKTHTDEAIAEVCAARKALCDRFGNDPRRLLAYLRAGQRDYHGNIIKNWSEPQPATVWHETPPVKKRSE
jgi:hypothetical protein